MSILFINASNLFVVDDFAYYVRPDTLKIEIINQTLSLTSAIKSPKFQASSNTLSFVSSVTLNKVKGIVVTQDFDFFGMVYKAKDHQYLLSNLQLSHSAKVGKFLSVSNTLTLTHSIVKSNGFSQTLPFVSTVAVNIFKVISLTDNLGVVSNTTFFKEATVDFVAIAVPTFVPTNIVLTYGLLSVNLRKPVIGDALSLEHAKINRMSRGGDLIIFRNAQWPRTEMLKYRFENIKERDAQKLLQIVDQAFGKDIILVDYEGITWTGFITNAEQVIEQLMRGTDQDCDLPFSFDLEFQGVQS